LAFIANRKFVGDLHPANLVISMAASALPSWLRNSHPALAPSDLAMLRVTQRKALQTKNRT